MDGSYWGIVQIMLVGEEEIGRLYCNVQYNAVMLGGDCEFKVTGGIGKL